MTGRVEIVQLTKTGMSMVLIELARLVGVLRLGGRVGGSDSGFRKLLPWGFSLELFRRLVIIIA